MELYLLSLFLIFLGFCCWKYSKLPKNLPPGPVGIPFLGYIPLMGKKQHLLFSNLKATYGDIFGFYIGQKFFVVLSSCAVIKEALIKHGNNFAARPAVISATPPEFKDTPGIVLSSGSLFNELKQTVVQVFKTFTRSDGNGEFVVKNEIEYLLGEIDQHLGKPIDISELIFSSVTNVIWFFLFAERIEKNDQKFKDMIHNVQTRVEAINFAGIELGFPQIFSISLIRNIFRASIAIDAFRRIHKYFNDKINKIDTSSSSVNEFNFMQKWFELHPKNSARYDFYRQQLPPITMDLFGAGVETTAIFLQWAILYMMQYPDTQKKVQTEINDVIGKLNKPSMLDKNKMPYTEATLMEILRISPVLPLGVPHLNINKSTINGYTIPESSVILTNIWEVHHNPEVFPNPEVFRPERFLENGEFKKIEDLIPFSIGKRQCIGEVLARMESFLIFTSLLQRYTFVKPGEDQLDFTYDFSNVVRPRPHNVIAVLN